MMFIKRPCTHQERIKIEGNKPSAGFAAGARVHGSRSWPPPVGRAVRARLRCHQGGVACLASASAGGQGAGRAWFLVALAFG